MKVERMAPSAFSNIAERLNRAGVVYCMLRNAMDPHSPAAEMDLLVWPKYRAEFRNIAACAGFQRAKHNRALKETYSHFDGERILFVDVHYALVQNDLVYMNLKGIENRLEEGCGGGKILSKEDQLLHLFFHSLIGKGRVQTKHLPILRELSSLPLDVDYLRRTAGDGVIWEVLTRFLKDPSVFCEDADVFQEAAEKVRSRVLRRSVGNWWRRLYGRSFKKWFRRRRGVHFAFLGVDGAGKSTLIREVNNQLASFGKVKVKTVYMGPWGQSRTVFLRWCLRTKIIPSRDGWRGLLKKRAIDRQDRLSVSSIAKKMISGKVKGWIYFAALYLDLWYRYLQEIRPALRKGEVVLSDRYVYDARYIHKKRIMRQHRGWRSFMCFFFPGPDRIFYLHNAANEVVRRKPQLGVGEVELFQKYYVKALRGLPVTEIVTDRPAVVLSEEVTDAILGRYLACR